MGMRKRAFPRPREAPLGNQTSYRICEHSSSSPLCVYHGVSFAQVGGIRKYESEIESTTPNALSVISTHKGWYAIMEIAGKGLRIEGEEK